MYKEATDTQINTQGNNDDFYSDFDKVSIKSNIVDN